MSEFKVGDKVTFKAYEDEIRAKVIRVKHVTEVMVGYSEDVGIDPSKVFWYALEGLYTPFKSLTSGTNIKESKYFEG